MTVHEVMKLLSRASTKLSARSCSNVARQMVRCAVCTDSCGPDSKLSLKQHVKRTASTCFYHLRRLRQLKRHVNVDVMKWLISAFVFSPLDYCNGILSGRLLATIAPLQRVQNAPACLVLGFSQSDHVRPALKELHWLPVVYRIKFKLALVMFAVAYDMV